MILSSLVSHYQTRKIEIILDIFLSERDGHLGFELPLIPGKAIMKGIKVNTMTVWWDSNPSFLPQSASYHLLFKVLK